MKEIIDMKKTENLEALSALSNLLSLSFDLEEKVLSWIVRVLHPGLQLEDEEQQKLAREVMWQIMRNLTMATGTKKMKKRISEVFNKALSKTITGEGLILLTPIKLLLFCQILSCYRVILCHFSSLSCTLCVKTELK